MERNDLRERRFQKINRAFVALYCLTGCALAAVYALRGDGYHLGVCLGTLAIPAAMAAFYRLLRLEYAHQMNFLILTFTALAYTLGSGLDFYRRFPGYDKLVHMLSGALVSLMCMALFCALLPGGRPGRREQPLLLAFTFFGSMAVAGLWEIGEYALSFICGRDLQNVAATGVGDSMQDMIVCMIGTLAALPAAAQLAGGKSGLISGAVWAFAEKNLWENPK